MSSYEDGYVDGWRQATEEALEAVRRSQWIAEELRNERDREYATKLELLEVVNQELGIDLTQIKWSGHATQS